jgi:acetyl esterase
MYKLKSFAVVSAVAALVGASAAAQAAPVLEPATQQFIDALTAQKGPPIYTLSAADARNVLAGAQSQPVSKEAAQIEDRVIEAGPTGKIAMRIERPARAKGVLPVIMYFHGGGWVLGDKNTHDRLIREIANGTQAAVVFVDYDRSPETKFPVPAEEAYAVTLRG